MERIPNGRYTKEFREEAVKLVVEDGLSVQEASRRLDLPKSTIFNWIRSARAGKLGEIGKQQRQLSEAELELARLKRELAKVRMERDILKKAAAYFAKESM
jgi:transposase